MKLLLSAISSLPLIMLLNTGCSESLTSTSAKSQKKTTADSDGQVLAATSAVQSDDHEAKKVAESFADDSANSKDSKGNSNSKKSEPKSKQTPSQNPSQHPHPGQHPGQSPAQMSYDDYEQEDITGITVTGFQYSGDACPDGSVASNISPDAKAFTLLFDSFYAEADPAAAVFQEHVTCNVQVKLLAPSGWQVALMSVDFRGYADLADSDEAVLTSKYQFTGSTFADSFKAIIQGGQSNDFQARSDAFLKTSNWSGCGIEKTLNMDISMLVKSGGDTTASISLDAVDGELSYKAGFMWRKCP